MTVEQMKLHYGIIVETVSNINDQAFLDNLQAHHIDAGISLGCYQRFRSSITNFFSSPRILLNLHPGILPAYQGVMTAFRSMMNNEREFRYSLHHINEDEDSGAVIDIRSHPIDYGKSMLGFMNDVYPVGVDMILDAIERSTRGNELPAVEQDPGKSGYYSFPYCERS